MNTTRTWLRAAALLPLQALLAASATATLVQGTYSMDGNTVRLNPTGPWVMTATGDPTGSSLINSTSNTTNTLTSSTVGNAITTVNSASTLIGTITGTTTPTVSTSLQITPQDYSALIFKLTAPVTFRSLTSLSSKYDVLSGGISGGSPRFVIKVDTDPTTGEALKYFSILWGDPTTSFVNSSPVLGARTGNLLAGEDPGRYDLTGLGLSGQTYTTRTAALAAAGQYEVRSIDLVIDSFLGNGLPKSFNVYDITVLAADKVVGQVPEPAAWLLAACALGALVYRRRQTGAAPLGHAHLRDQTPNPSSAEITAPLMKWLCGAHSINRVLSRS